MEMLTERGCKVVVSSTAERERSVAHSGNSLWLLCMITRLSCLWACCTFSGVCRVLLRR